jgi:hypothetical protein
MTNPVQASSNVSQAAATVAAPRKEEPAPPPEAVQDKVTISKAARVAAGDADHDGDSR